MSVLAQGGTGSPPAGGGAMSEVIFGTLGAMILTAAMFYLVLGHRSGRVALLRRLGGTSERISGLPGVGVAAARRALGRAADRRLRHVLGHLDAPRRGARRGPVRQRLALLHPRRAVRRVLRRPARDLPPRRAARAHRDRAARRAARADRRAADPRLLGRRAHRLPARRRLAPHLRPGRDAVGADAPAAVRRRLALHARRDDPADGGRGVRPRRHARTARAALAARAAGAARRRVPDRPLDLPGRVRLRRPAVPPRLPPDPADARLERRARRGADLGRPRGRARRRAVLHPRARDPDRARLAAVRPHDAALPALPRRGGRSSSSSRCATAATGRSRSGSRRASASARSGSPPSGPGRTPGGRSSGPSSLLLEGVVCGVRGGRGGRRDRRLHRARAEHARAATQARAALRAAGRARRAGGGGGLRHADHGRRPDPRAT